MIFESGFEALFDDVFQDPQYAAIFKRHPLLPDELRGSLAAAELFDWPVAVSGRLLIDNRPAITLLRHREWCRIARRSLRVYSSDSTWDEFLANAGGTESDPPVIMSSFSGERNAAVQAAWRPGDSHDSRREFVEAYPDALDMVEMLKREAFPLHKPCGTVSYTTCLDRRLESAGFGPRYRSEFLPASSRGKAIQIAETLRGEFAPPRYDVLVRAIISAKHDELAAQTGVPSLAEPAAQDSQSSSAGRHTGGAESVDGIGTVLTGAISPEEIEAVSSDERFRRLLNELRAARHYTAVSEIAAIIRRMGARMAEVIGRTRSTSGAMALMSIGTTMVGGRPFLEGHARWICVSAGCLLILAAAPGGRSSLAFDRIVYRHFGAAVAERLELEALRRHGVAA